MAMVGGARAGAGQCQVSRARSAGQMSPQQMSPQQLMKAIEDLQGQLKAKKTSGG